MRTKILAGVLFLVPFQASAQNAEVPRPNLELRLVAGELRNGVPKAFTFELVNVSDHDVCVPQPVVDCYSDFYGYIWLRLVWSAPHATEDVPLDHLDDVGLLLHGLGKVAHGVCIEDKAGSRGAMWKRWKARQFPGCETLP